MLRFSGIGSVRIAVAPPLRAARRGCVASSADEAAQRKTRVREAVDARRPEVARARLIEELEQDRRWLFTSWFTSWLSEQDKVFRESLHETSFSGRWRRAQTTDLVYKHKSWNRLRGPYRYIKVFSAMGFLKSDIVRRLIFPDLTVLAFTSTSLCLYNTVIAQGPESMLMLPIEPFTVTSMAVGLLVTFRTQTSYNRYNQARLAWNRTVCRSRELCSRILARIPTPRANIERHPEILRKQIHGAKLAQTFAHALKYHITVDGDNSDLRSAITYSTAGSVILEKKRACFRDELELIWDFNDVEEREIVERLLDETVHNWPLQVCQELTHLNATAYCAPNPGGLGHPNSEGVDQLISSLQEVIVDSEHLIQTPIYTPYTVFTGRILYVWVNTVAFALYPLVGPVCTPVISVFTGFLMLGIDDIGSRVEQPFDILPLWQYVANLDKDCEQLMNNAKLLR